MADNGVRLVDSGTALTDTGMVHRVRQPPGEGPHPTVVMLHGRSGNEDAMWVFAPTLPPDWLVVAPRAIKTDPGGGYSWHPRQPDEWPSLTMFDPAVTAVVAFLNALPALYQADLDRLYFMGFSQGAATAYAATFHYPEITRGIAGLVGFVPGEVGALIQKRSLSAKPVFMAVGREDELIPFEQAERCAQVLRQAGANLEYKEYDTGHRLNAQGMRDLKAWWEER